MADHQADEQFEATDYDQDGNIKQTPPPPAAAKKKRVTVAGLSKAIDDIRDVKFPETLNWIGELDTRLDKIDRMGLENLPSFISDSTERFQKLEKGIAILQGNQGSLLNSYTSLSEDIVSLPSPATLEDTAGRLDNQDAAIGAIATALRQHLEEVAAALPEPKPELMFAQPPALPEQVTATKGDIEAVASVCQTMSDVLMICRALKAVQDLPDDDRTYLLTTACRAAGVPLSVGLQIRAGAKYREA